MVSTTGAELLPTVAVSYLRDLILPLATILTPNVPEALKLLEYAHKTQPRLTSLQDMVTLAKRTLQLGSTYVLLKGGHLPLTAEGKVAGKVEERQMVVNVLCNKQNTYILKMDYLNAKNTHGTGCSLACKADSLLLCPSSSLSYLSDNILIKVFFFAAPSSFWFHPEAPCPPLTSL